ncbi:site-specific integrase [Marispirochaeta aestuarii]|uniref:tyrosine-type recombinase/integrase n=1 Tax=Marispirochaeta aestuarii TaxID=1963862 RepID=UPI0029C8E25D|nr:site-specific integrase [Marispirochaeta aestuarii]
MPAPFKIIKRKDRPYFLAAYLLPDGTYTAARSTGETSRRKAEAVAWKHVLNGKVSASTIATVADICKLKKDPDTGKEKSHFFDWENEWALNRRSAGKRLSKHHCKHNNSLLDTHVIPMIGKVKLSDLDTVTVRNVRNNMFKKGYAGQTINHVLGVIKHLIEWADDHHLIRHHVRIERAAIKNKARGVLTQAEVKKLFAEKWSKDPRPFVASMIAAATGFRLGEIQGLRIADYERGRLTVRGVWSDSDGGYRPGTKNGQESRSVPIPPAVCDEIEKLIAANPWSKFPGQYLIYSLHDAGRPIGDKAITGGYYKALKLIGITEDIRKQRNITFHSFRHFFNSMLIESRVPVEKIQQLTGHLSAAMTAHYYHATEFDDVAEAQERLFKVV